MWSSDVVQSKVSYLILFCIQFLKLSEIIPKSWCFGLFLEVFWPRPLKRYGWRPNFLPKWKALWWYIIVVSFISIAYVVAKLWICKCCPGTRKVDFRLLLGGFLGITPPNGVRFVWNLDQWCSATQGITCHKILYKILKDGGEEAKKPFF